MISLFPHQQEALQETKDFDNIAVYHDMGLGKTFTGSEMMKRFGCKVNLIVCQKSKVQDWVEHFTDNYQMQVFDLTNKKQLGDDHVLAHGTVDFIGLFKDGSICFEMETRFTIIYKWTNGKWLVQHLHQSIPDLEQMDGEEFPVTLGKQVKKTSRRFMH